jgi:DNA-directed RNA polymerase specialized sigma24 family protein
MPAHDTERSGGSDATLSPSEVVQAIQALEDGEKTALAKIARLYAGKTPYDHADLLQEALCRVLSGERKWPKGLPPVLFLGGVIRSIAWQWRQREAWSGREASDSAATDAPQEWELYFKQVIGLFADDPAAQAVLLAIMEGNKGQELLSVIEPILSNKRKEARDAEPTVADLERELERVLKKIRRRVEKHRREAGPI